MAKGEKTRKKLSAKWFTVIIGSLLALLIAFAIALPCVTVTYYDGVLRDVFKTAGTSSPEESEDPEIAKLDKDYNKTDFKTADELSAYEKDLVRTIGGEGYVLLENSDAPGKGLPLKTEASNKTKVSLFSHSSVDIIAGGTGSGTGVASVTLKDAFEAQNFEVNKTLWDFYSTGGGKSYKRGAGVINYGMGEDWKINECPLTVLESGGVLNSAAGTTPIFILSRTGGEGMDLARYMGKFTDVDADKTKHYLEPDSVELNIIDYLNRNFTNVILVVNTNNVPELGWVKNYANIGAVLWAPGGGGETANSIVDVISGKATASGHLVDTIAYDAFSSPAMKNMGDFQYSVGGKAVNAYGISYDEGIYVGYKYYETRYFDKVMGQGNAGDYDYAATVQYPFGYGKSYTNFEWSDFSVSAKDADGNITVNVTVTNKGDVAGKDVVQVYVQAPYTDYDKTNYVEKSAVSLVGFKKTKLLAKDASETVSVTVNVEDFVSYDDRNAKTFILEDGDYLITAAADAHKATNNFLAKKGKTKADGMTENGDSAYVGVWNNPTFDKTTYAESSTGETVTNRFDESNYIDRDEYLSRRDWVATFPKTHGNQDGKVVSGMSEQNGYVFVEEISQDLLNKINAKGTAEAARTPMTDAEAASKAGQYEQGGDMELVDIRGKDFKEIDWDSLVSKMTKKEVGAIVNKSGYVTLSAKSINKPQARDLDGPAGLNTITNHTMLSITYPSEVNIACTFDKEFSYKVGDAIAQDGLTFTQVLGRVSGWYGPAMNIHRTPFAGRNFEYYSEDSYMSGVMAREAVVGAAKKGMYGFIKHFALNDQENHRIGICTWSNEQAIREIYLRPFKMAVEGGTVTTKYYETGKDANGKTTYTLKEAQTPACMAVMSSFNRIGYTWAGGDYRLITQVLRNEWGFNGMVETDYSQGGTGYMHTEQMLRAGADVQLSQQQASYAIKNDTMVYYTKQAMKHVLYCVGNSNAMNGYVHGVVVGAEPFAYYYLILIAVGVIALGLSAWGGIAIWQRWKAELSEGKEPVEKAE